MKQFIIGAARLWSGFALLLAFTTAAQDFPKVTSNLPTKGRESLAFVRWRVTGREGHLLCEVSQMSDAVNGSLPTRVLTIYRDDRGKPEEIFTFKTPDVILNIYPLGDFNARLFTTWVGGSGYHVRVFTVVEGHVKEVLEEGTRTAPELIYDDQGQESILLTTPAIENGKWTSINGTTTVFKWNGRNYDKLGTVPWADRLRCLSTDSCRPSK